MRHLGRATLVLALVLMMAGAVEAAEGDDPSVGEKVGELRLSASAAAVTKLLGPPPKRGPVVPQGVPTVGLRCPQAGCCLVARLCLFFVHV